MRLLRGRTLIRPTGDSGGFNYELSKLGLVTPDTYAFDPRQQKNQNSLGRGVVVAMGPPAFDKKHREVLPDYKVGDEVIHIGQHISREVVVDGELLRSCSQEEVCAVIERGRRVVGITVDGVPFGNVDYIDYGAA